MLIQTPKFYFVLVADFILAYTIVGLEVHFFVSKGGHVISLDEYHKGRTNAKIETLFVLQYLQVIFIECISVLILFYFLIIAVIDSSSPRVLECHHLCLDQRGLSASDGNLIRHQ